ncbi:MAG: L-aspartate oxidase [Candidatus Dormibacteria bacterium]
MIRPKPQVELLIVGAGLAGLSAALEARAGGASVVVVTTGPGASERAQGGIAAAVGPGDSPGLHARDTMVAGASAGDWEMIKLLAGSAPQAVAWLAAQGMEFDLSDQGPALALEAAHSRPRVLHARGDATGAALMATLRARLSSLPAGRAASPCREGRLVALLVENEVVVGARFCHHARQFEVRAKDVLLATGGYAGLFPRTPTSRACDGSALISALEAGASLADLEFIQFHPTVFAGSGEPFLLTEALRGAGAYIVDGAGRRFLIDVDPAGELAPRATVTTAIVRHLGRQGSPHVFLDCRHLGPRLAHEFPGFVNRCRAAGLDPCREPVPVAPAAHYTMGGIATDSWGRTGIAGLLAAGECTRTGVHGANRLASNSLLEAVVFGRRAAQAALGEAAPLSGPPLDGDRLEVAGQGSRLLPASREVVDREQVGHVLAQALGPIRDGAVMERGLEHLQVAAAIDAEAERVRRLASLVLRAALIRTESRGAHVRSDHSALDPAWAERSVVVRWDPEAGPIMEVIRRRSLDTGPHEAAPCPRSVALRS